MNNFLTKTLNLIKLYKWILLPVIPMVLFLIILSLFVFSPQETSSPQEEPTPTLSPNETSSPTEINPDYDVLEGNESEESPESLPEFLKKEVLSNGNTVYSFSSENPSRPNIKILTPNNQQVFARTLNSTEYELPSVSLFKETYGEPEQTIRGSNFYGPSAEIFVYASLGMAFIGNSKSDLVFEKHYFNPMTVEEYTRFFGNQN